MGDEIDSERETGASADEGDELTAEQAVAADTAMLLDLGGSEALAEGIAAQSGGGDTVVDRRLPLEPQAESEPETDDDGPSSA